LLSWLRDSSSSPSMASLAVRLSSAGRQTPVSSAILLHRPTLQTITPAPFPDHGLSRGVPGEREKLAPRVDHVDAVDASAAMVEAGRGRPGGRRRNLRWMTWNTTLPRLIAVMGPNAFLAVVEHGHRDLPWGRS
jgi:hypothetical protein